MAQNKSLRIGLASLTAIIAAACLTTTIVLSQTVEVDLGILPLTFNDVTSQSLDARMVLAQSLFQVSLLMIGALWGLVIAKPGEIQILFREKIEMIMFISASIVLLVSVSSYALYLEKISHQFVDAVRAWSKSDIPLPVTVPDVFDQNVNYLFNLQCVSLAAGIINGVLTLVSAHKLRT